MDEEWDKDLAGKLNELLSSPDSMQKIQAAMSALGLGGAEEPGEGAAGASALADGLDMGALSELLGSLTASSPAPASASPPEPSGPRVVPPKPESGGLDLSLLTRLAPMMATFNREDSDTVLLRALRPYLHGDREKRLDDAIKILRFIKIMPLLREKGLF